MAKGLVKNYSFQVASKSDAVSILLDVGRFYLRIELTLESQ